MSVLPVCVAGLPGKLPQSQSGCQLSCGFAPISHWVAVIIVVAAVDVAAVAAPRLVDSSVTLSHAPSPWRGLAPFACHIVCTHTHTFARTPKHTQTYASKV